MFIAYVRQVDQNFPAAMKEPRTALRFETNSNDDVNRGSPLLTSQSITECSSVSYVQFSIQDHHQDSMANVAKAEIRIQRAKTPVLDVEYEESGSANDSPIILLHGFPYDVRQYDTVRDNLVQLGHRVIVPYLRGYGGTRYRDASTVRSGSQAALAQDLVEFLDAVEISRAVLVGYDWGGRAACIVAALWPERVRGLVSCQGYAVQDIADMATQPKHPEVTLRRWYTHYFNTPQGIIGLEAERYNIGKLLWKLWSPNWKFTEAEYAETAKAFDNPDYVHTVIHSYRHRYANVDDDPNYLDIESKLVQKPLVTVPTIIVTGGSDGVEPQSESDPHREKFTGYYERHWLPDVGHCPPAEAPLEIVAAVKTLLSVK